MSTEGKKIKLFLVEDDEFALEVMKDRFSDNKQLEVSVFATAEECITKIGEKPEVVVLDFFLNKVNEKAMNGAEALDLILKSSELTKVIMLTGQFDLTTAEELMKRGAYYYISKDESALDKLERKVNYIVSFLS